jgi:hypothetical protein
MSAPNVDPPNPYASPAPAPLSAGAPMTTPTVAMIKLVKDFRSQIHALGGFWIFIGGLVAVLMVVASGTLVGQAGEVDENARLIAMGIFFAIGGAWIALGVFTCLKQMWAVYVGLVLSYLSVIGNVINLNVCGLVILAAVIIQAHRVIGWSKQLRQAGIPLTTRPEQLRVEFRFPQGTT